MQVRVRYGGGSGKLACKPVPAKAKLVADSSSMCGAPCFLPPGPWHLKQAGGSQAGRAPRPGNQPVCVISRADDVRSRWTCSIRAEDCPLTKGFGRWNRASSSLSRAFSARSASNSVSWETET